MKMVSVGYPFFILLAYVSKLMNAKLWYDRDSSPELEDGFGGYNGYNGYGGYNDYNGNGGYNDYNAYGGYNGHNGIGDYNGYDANQLQPQKPKSCNGGCEHWCYPSTDWAYTCPTYCGDKSQSPIDIIAKSAKSKFGSITFSSSYSDTIGKIKIKNNGHSAVASWDSSLSSRTISGGGLPDEYILEQFHFHWGCNNNRGSEHAVNGIRYAMEVHFVHYNAFYGNFSEAVRYVDGLAVLGVFFDVGAENAALKPFTDGLPNIVKSGSEKWINFNVALINLIPATRTFYRYQGSLTTPGCNEVVTWTLFCVPLRLSEDQVKVFRMLKDHEGHHLCDNYRDTQALNGREVKKYSA